MPLFDNLFELLHGVGGAVGAGGGLVAGEIYRRFNKGVKDAKDAKLLVEALAEKVKKELEPKLQTFVTHETLERQISKLMRGSRPDVIPSDPLVMRRLDELERRVSGVEDDNDERAREDRKWAEEVKEQLGRIEGQIQR